MDHRRGRATSENATGESIENPAREPLVVRDQIGASDPDFNLFFYYFKLKVNREAFGGCI
jgi:hypothetical protein